MTARWQLTMAILKPHIIANIVACQKIKEIIIGSNLKVVKCKRKTISFREAELFYHEHKQKFFYNRLVAFMTSGPSDLLILTKDTAIKDWRALMGPTKVFKAQYDAPESIRGQFGLSDTRNATHGSDSEESAKREINILFPNFDIEQWYATEELLFRTNRVNFSEDMFVHQSIVQ